MNSLSTKQDNMKYKLAYGKKISPEEQQLINPLIKEFTNNGFKNPSLSLHMSMVYGFAYHLPYSMDIEQEEYVPGDFLNIEPTDVNTNNWFKWDDRRTFYNSMVRWGDTFRSGILLQVCYIFQQMLLGNIPADYKLNEKDYESLGINELTRNEEYNKNFFNILSSLPTYYQKVIYSENNTERRKNLRTIYNEICSGIEMKVGGLGRQYADDTYVEHEATISWDAYRDVQLRVWSENIRYYDGLNLDLTKKIKKIQLKQHEENKKISKK